MLDAKISFSTLENVPIKILAETFNKAFENYFVEIHLNPDQLKQKFIADGVDLQKSVGAFQSGKLIGFIFHAFDSIDGISKAYNSGTGVIAEARGQNLSNKMYEFIKEELMEQNSRCLLEVITKNSTAVDIYKKEGFNIKRKLDCYFGSVVELTENKNYQVSINQNPDWLVFNSFWDWTPSWQNSVGTIKRSERSVEIATCFLQNKPIAYAAYKPANGQILQFAVDKEYRRKGAASTLFNFIAKNTKGRVSLLNIDHESIGSSEFLKAMGLKAFIQQYEMEAIYRDLSN